MTIVDNTVLLQLKFAERGELTSPHAPPRERGRVGVLLSLTISIFNGNISV